MLRRIAVPVTSRANYARVKSVLLAIRGHLDLDLQLVVVAPRSKDGTSLLRCINTDEFVVKDRISLGDLPSDSQAMAAATGILVKRMSAVFGNLAPNIVVVLADRFEILGIAIAAAYMNIPLAHLLGGEISGSIDEKVRHAVTKLSDLHFVSNQKARARLVAMGESNSSVYVTGCPSMDLALPLRQEVPTDPPQITSYLSGPSVPDLARSYLVLIQHPVTSQACESLEQARISLEALSECGMQTLVFQPNIDPGSDRIRGAIEQFARSRLGGLMYPCKNMPPELFLRIVAKSRCIVGNSSIGIREASFLGIPAVNIGTRQAGRDRASNVLDVPHCRQEIKAAILNQLARSRYPATDLYGDGKAGRRIARILAKARVAAEKRYVQSKDG